VGGDAVEIDYWAPLGWTRAGLELPVGDADQARASEAGRRKFLQGSLPNIELPRKDGCKSLIR